MINNVKEYDINMIYYKLKKDDNYINISYEYIQNVLSYLYNINNNNDIDILIRYDILNECKSLLKIPYIYDKISDDYNNDVNTININKMTNYNVITTAANEIKKIIKADVIYDTNADNDILSFRTYIIYLDKYNDINMAYYLRYNSVGVLFKVYDLSPGYPFGSVYFEKMFVSQKNKDENNANKVFREFDIEFDMDQLFLTNNNVDYISKKIIDNNNNDKILYDMNARNNITNSTVPLLINKNTNFKKYYKNDNDYYITMELCAENKNNKISDCLNSHSLNMNIDTRYYLKINKSDYYTLIFLNVSSEFLPKKYEKENEEIMFYIYDRKLNDNECKEQSRLMYVNKFDLDIKNNKLLKYDSKRHKKEYNDEYSLEKLMNLNFTDYLISNNEQNSLIARYLLIIRKYKMISLLNRKHSKHNRVEYFTILKSVIDHLLNIEENREIRFLNKLDFDMINNFSKNKYELLKIDRNESNYLTSLYKNKIDGSYIIKYHNDYYEFDGYKAIKSKNSKIINDLTNLIFLYKDTNSNFYAVNDNLDLFKQILNHLEKKI